MKVAILETDILRPELLPDYIGYGRMFLDLFARVGVDWHMEVFSVISGDYPARIEEFDAFLITGSKHDAFADDDWIVRLRDYCRKLYDLGKPQVGICFGHQLLAHALGGRAERAGPGWGLGIMEYPLAEKPVFIDDDKPVSLLISHRDQVTVLPEAGRLLLSNDFCPFAGYYIPNLVFCVQGHPEFSKDYEEALLGYHDNDVSAEQMASIRSSMTEEHQGERIGRWIRNFLEQALGADKV